MRTKANTAAGSQAFASEPCKVTVSAAKSLTLTFNANGGSAVANITGLRYQGELSALPTSTRAGYTLEGWYAGGNKLTLDTVIEADAAYTAQWAVNSYKMVFQANGGTGAMPNQSFTYDAAAQALLQNQFSRTGYTFAGWNTAADGSGTLYTDQQSVRNLTDLADGTVALYAQWTKDGNYAVSGQVTKEESENKVSNAIVELKRGNQVIATTTTDANGNYSFANIAPGAYNLVVTSGAGTAAKTVTDAVTVTTGNVTKSIAIRTASDKNTILQVEPGTPSVVVKGLTNLAVDGATVKMVVKTVPENAQDNEQSGIRQFVQNGSQVEFLDMSIVKQVLAGVDAGQESNIHKTNDVLEIIMPFDFTGKEHVKVIRYHAEDFLLPVKEFSELAAIPATSVDGTFYADKENGLLYIYANKFSTYAINYTVPGTTGTTGGSTGTGTSAAVAGPRSPKTGDASQLVLWKLTLAMALCGMGMLGYIYYRKRRKNQ